MGTITSLITNKIEPTSIEQLMKMPEFLLQAARGVIDNVFTVNKFGRNDVVDAATDEDVITIGGDLDLTQLDGAVTTVGIASASGNDKLGQSGAETVTLYGLDGNYDLASEDIDLDGATEVTSVGTYRFIYRAEVIASNNGANDSYNAGIITFNKTGGNDVMNILAGKNQTQHCAYMIPAGYEGFIYQSKFNFLVASAAAVGTPEIHVKKFGLPFTMKYDSVIANGEKDAEDWLVPLKIPEKAIIKLRFGTDKNTSVITGKFDMVMMPKFE